MNAHDANTEAGFLYLSDKDSTDKYIDMIAEDEYVLGDECQAPVVEWLLTKSGEIRLKGAQALTVGQLVLVDYNKAVAYWHRKKHYEGVLVPTRVLSIKRGRASAFLYVGPALYEGEVNEEATEILKNHWFGVQEVQE